MTLTNQYTWDEVVNNIANQIEARNSKFKRNEFVKWYKTKEYAGKPFDPTLIYMNHKIYKRLYDDKDNVTVIAGIEGDGKTTLGINSCSLVSENFNFPATCFTKNELIQSMKTSKKGDSILADEGGIMLFSREAMNTTNKMAIKLFMAIRAKNLNFVICVPNFFLLDSYIREHRVNMLIQIKKRGYYRGFTRDGIKVLNEYAKSKNVFNVKISSDKFWDGTFNKAISSNYDYQKYLQKKDDNINRYLDEALMDTSDKVQGMIPISIVAKKLSVHIDTVRQFIKRGEVKAKKIGQQWFISEEDYKKLTES